MMWLRLLSILGINTSTNNNNMNKKKNNKSKNNMRGMSMTTIIVMRSKIIMIMIIIVITQIKIWILAKIIQKIHKSGRYIKIKQIYALHILSPYSEKFLSEPFPQVTMAGSKKQKHLPIPHKFLEKKDWF